MEASYLTSACLNFNETVVSPISGPVIRCYPSHEKAEDNPEGLWKIITNDVNDGQSENESNSPSSQEDYGVFNKFRTINSQQVIEEGEVAETYDIDFDRESLEFSPFLIQEQSIAQELSSMELSPFESNDSSDEEPVSKIKSFIGVLKNAIKGHNKTKEDVNDDIVRSSDFSNDLIASSVQLATYDHESSLVAFKSTPLELCKCEEWLPRPEFESRPASSSIKFKNLADIYLYDDSQEAKETHEDSVSLLERKTGPSNYPFPNSGDGSWNNDYQSKLCSKKVSSILKKKVNDNFDVEAANARNTENIRLGVFLKNFENLELEKYKNEPELNELRNIQIRNYYANQK